MRRHHGRPTRRLPLEPDPRTPIRLTLPRWLSTRIRTESRALGRTEFSFVVAAVQNALEHRPGDPETGAR